MNIIKAKAEIITQVEEIPVLMLLEQVARTCYKSEGSIVADGSSAKILVKKLLTKNHRAMIEFFDIIVKLTIDTGVSHEVVRHRIASYAQESSRYCNYMLEKFGSHVTFIDIADTMRGTIGSKSKLRDGSEIIITESEVRYWLVIWEDAMRNAESAYLEMVSTGCPAEFARAVLPKSLKTEIMVKMNLREWMHFFSLRTKLAAHPQMREVAIPLLEQFKEKLPLIFNNI